MRPSRPESQGRERSACTPRVQAAAGRGPGLLPPKAVGGAALIAHALEKCRRENPARWSDVLLSPPWAPRGVQHRPPEGPGGCWATPPECVRLPGPWALLDRGRPPKPPACTTSARAALLPASWLWGGRPVPPRLSGCTLGVCSPGARSTHTRGDSRRGHHHRRRARFPRHGPFRAQWLRSGWPRPLPMPGTCRKRPSGPSVLFPPDNRGQRLTQKTGNL